MTLPSPLTANLMRPLPDAIGAEVFTELLRRPGCRIERIVSQGQTTPLTAPYRQEHDEWVLLLAGSASVRMEGEEILLTPGDHLLIPAGVEHWVTSTTREPPTVWLAIHLA